MTQDNTLRGGWRGRRSAGPKGARRSASGRLALVLLVSLGGNALAEPRPAMDVPAVAAASVRLSLAPSSAGAPDARVLVNGKPLGEAPLELALQPGRYLIEVTATGYLTWRQWVDAVAGQNLALVARLEPVAAPVSQPAPRTPPRGTLTVLSTVVGAEVFVDGELLGRAPIENAELLAGPHVVAVRAAGHEELLTTVEVLPGAAARVDAPLQPEGHPAAARPAFAQGTPAPATANTAKPAASARLGPAQGGGRLRAMTSHAATLVDPAAVAGDVALGFPHLITARFTVGLLDQRPVGRPIGVDGSVEFRSFGALTEVGGRARVRLIDRRPWALATSVALGGGGGPKSRNSLFVDLAAIGSVWLAERVALSARTTIGLYSDRLCPASASRNEVGACSVPPAGLSSTAVRGRFTGLRWLLAGVVEVPITPWINVFGSLEFAPWQGNRRAFSDAFVSLMPSSDPGVYGCVGVTLKR